MIFKIIMIFKKINTYSASIFREQRLSNTGELINSPPINFKAHVSPALILPLSSSLKINVNMPKILA